MTADEKLEASQSLLSEISAGLAEIVEAFSTRQTSADEMASALADIAGAIEAYKAQPLTELIAAVKSIRITAPAVTVKNEVNVNPTPIHNNLPAPVVQIIERVQPGDYRLTVKYDNHDRITEALISKITQKTP